MPKFEETSRGGVTVTIDTDGGNDTFTVLVGKKSLKLTREVAEVLSNQIGYAVEFVNLYDRGPR